MPVGPPEKRLSGFDPAEALKRLELANAAMRAKRARKSVEQAERIETLIHSPMDHLGKFARAEWEVVCRHLADAGASEGAIAATMGVTKNTVHRILHRPHVQALISAIRAQQVAAMVRGDFGAQAVLKAAQTRAAKKVVETVDDTAAGPKLNLTAAESVLDRTGLGRQSNVDVHHVHEILRHFTPAEMREYADKGIAPARYRELFEALEAPTDVTPSR